MSVFTVNLLGRKYQIETSLSLEEIEKIEKKIEEDISQLEVKFPDLDRIDIFILYLIELWEKFFTMEKQSFQKKDSYEIVKKRIKKIIDLIEKEIKTT